MKENRFFIIIFIIILYVVIFSRRTKREPYRLATLNRNTLIYALCLNDKDFMNNNQKLCGESSSDDYYLASGMNLATQIKLSKSGDYINLAEIKVFDQKNNQITPSKVETSSLYADSYSGNNLIDGNELSIVHTKNGTEWILVTLPKEVFIGKILIVNRKDCCQERAVGIKVETLLKGVVKTTQELKLPQTEYELNYDTYGVLPQTVAPKKITGKVNAECRGDPVANNDPSFYDFSSTMKLGRDLILEPFRFLKQHILGVKEKFDIPGVITKKRDLDPSKIYKRGVRKVSNTITEAKFGGVGCQEFPDEIFIETEGDPSIPAFSCTGYDCTIEGQKCLPGTVGSSGKTWICNNKKWVEVVDPCASYSDDTKNISQECYNKIWKEAGCLTPTITMGEWQKAQTKAGLVFDSYAWSVMNDEGHRNGCYTTDRSKWPESKTLYGDWIGNGILAQASKPLLTGERVYMIHSTDNYTKMVSESGVGKYYVGDIDKFKAENWDSYSSAGQGYKIRNT